MKQKREAQRKAGPLYKVTQYSICVPLGPDQWKKLSVIDDQKRKQWPECYDRFLKKIERSGVNTDTVEFNGHFGMNFFFKVEKLSHAERVVKKLASILGPFPPPTKKSKKS